MSVQGKDAERERGRMWRWRRVGGTGGIKIRRDLARSVEQVRAGERRDCESDRAGGARALDVSECTLTGEQAQTGEN